MGTVYCDVPCSVTLKAPRRAPTVLGGGWGKSLIGRGPPPGVVMMMGGSLVGGTHWPLALQIVPAAQDPQL